MTDIDPANNGTPLLKFYSQCGEDRAIASIFDESPSFFVDVGAFDGVKGNNTYYFELMGWKGICVEPHPINFPICAKNRPNSQCLNLAAWEEDGHSTEFYATIPGGASRIGRLDELKKTLKVYTEMEVSGPIRVQTRTLDSIFQEHGVPRGFGLLSIDVEGTELNVLRGFTLKNYLPRFVIIEYNNIEGERSRVSPHRPPQALYDYFGACEYVCVNNSNSINAIFCRDMKDAKTVALNWNWEGARGFINSIGIYVIAPWVSTEKEHAFLRTQSPFDSGVWSNIEICDSFDKADLYIVFWGGGPSPHERLKRCPPHSVLNFTRESSRCIPDPRVFGEETIYCEWPTNALNLQVWGADGPNPHERTRHYHEVIGAPFPKKTKLLSWITGGGYASPGTRNRIDFMKRFTDEYPGILDLHGRNTDEFDLSSIEDYKGPLESKWAALDPHEYTFAFENTYEPNYMSEKFNDAILAGCIPIYWGMTNIGDYYPEGSFVEVDITEKDAPEKVMRILESGYREEHLNDLYFARHLLINRYQFWPALCDLINRLMEKGIIDLRKLEQRRNRRQLEQRRDQYIF